MDPHITRRTGWLPLQRVQGFQLSQVDVSDEAPERCRSIHKHARMRACEHHQKEQTGTVMSSTQTAQLNATEFGVAYYLRQFHVSWFLRFRLVFPS